MSKPTCVLSKVVTVCPCHRQTLKCSSYSCLFLCERIRAQAQTWRCVAARENRKVTEEILET